MPESRTYPTACCAALDRNAIFDMQPTHSNSYIWLLFPVENVLSKYMAFRKPWMVKRILITNHAKPLHELFRTLVTERGEGNHFCEG